MRIHVALAAPFLLLAAAGVSAQGFETGETTPFAEEDDRGIAPSRDADSVVRDLTDDPVRDDAGVLQAESGGAEPAESGMGCAELDESCRTEPLSGEDK